MKKRALAGVLWLYAGWYAGATLALVTGLPDLIGPLTGVAAAGVVTIDPLGMIWKPRPRTSDPGAVSESLRPDAAS